MVRLLSCGRAKGLRFKLQRLGISCFQLRIGVHCFCLHWEMKGHWSRVNLVKCAALLKELHTTTAFISQLKKKVYFNPYIYAKATNNPNKLKNQCQLFCHVTGVFHWKIFATIFFCFIAHVAGEWHWSVNMLGYDWNNVKTTRPEL